MGNSNLLKWNNKIEQVNRRNALGYEATLDFNHGYIYGLKHAGVITMKEYNSLIKVHADYRNGDYRWYIDKNGDIQENDKAEITVPADMR